MASTPPFFYDRCRICLLRSMIGGWMCPLKAQFCVCFAAPKTAGARVLAAASGKQICDECQIPLCAQCKGYVYNESAATLPPAALSNDMMTFYAPEELY